MKRTITIKLLSFLFAFLTWHIVDAQVVYQGNAKSSPPHNSPFDIAVISDFNIPDGTNVLLVIGTRISGSTATVTSINYNGVTYTTQEIQQAINGGGNQSLWAIPMGNITGGGITANLTISWSGGFTNGYGGIAASFSNVNQTTPIDGNVNSTTTSVSVATTLAGNMAIDFIGAGGTPVFSAGSGQTGPVINAPINSNANRISMSYELATGATTIMSWGHTGGSGALLHLGNNIIANSYPSLPVELTQFEASSKNEMVELMWQTASETNNQGFEVEHSTSGKDWRTVGFINGNGTSAELNTYQYHHESPISGINYYRLKQMDFDGAFEYSDIASVAITDFKNKEQLSVFPNPVKDGVLTIQLDTNVDDEIQIQLFDLTGKMWLQQSSFDTKTEVNVQTLPAGIYVAAIYTNGQTMRERIVVE